MNIDVKDWGMYTLLGNSQLWGREGEYCTLPIACAIVLKIVGPGNQTKCELDLTGYFS